MYSFHFGNQSLHLHRRRAPCPLRGARSTAPTAAYVIFPNDQPRYRIDSPARPVRTHSDEPTREPITLSNAKVTHYRVADQPTEELNPLISRSLITGERSMLAHVYLKKGAVVPMHSHDNEQITYVLEGALKFRIGDGGPEDLVVRTGEVLHLPSNVPHEAEALEDTIDVDVFTPPRQDWLDGTDSYLRGGDAGATE